MYLLMVILQVGVLAETPEYKWRQLKLAEPGNDSHVISLTLWGQQAVPEMTAGSQVCCSAVIKEESGLRGSPSTNIEVNCFVLFVLFCWNLFVLLFLHLYSSPLWGYEDILVMTDVYTKYSQAVACKDQTAKTAARVLCDMFGSLTTVSLTVYTLIRGVISSIA